VIVDEAHVIRKWGESGFRKDYNELGYLRSFVPTDVPFAAYSATMTAETREVVKKSLHLDPKRLVTVNLGNFRSNIIWDVRHISGTEKAIPEIYAFLPHMTVDTATIPLTLIFVNDRIEGHNIYSYLQETVPKHLLNQVHYLHSLRSQRCKIWMLTECHRNKHGIYICTEVAAMVSHILLFVNRLTI
jgi:superfamily II DNA helicase RecQ